MSGKHGVETMWIIGLLMAGLLVPASASAQTITVAPLPAAPVVDGDDRDWKEKAAQTIPVTGPLFIASVTVKAGVHGDEVFFLLQWADNHADIQHKPFIWDSKAGRYVAGNLREDRFSIQFAMEGDYDVNWFSGNAYSADMWHWKAARSNPIGLAHDKMTIIGMTPVKKAYQGKTEDGQTVYIQRPGDAGGKLYTTRRYRRHDQDVMPKYVLNHSVSGSVADVSAKGVWREGQWTLELRRKLNTGHPDDVVFAPGKGVPGGIAVFDRSGDKNHNISDNLLFQF